MKAITQAATIEALKRMLAGALGVWLLVSWQYALVALACMIIGAGAMGDCISREVQKRDAERFRQKRRDFDEMAERVRGDIAEGRARFERER